MTFRTGQPENKKESSWRGRRRGREGKGGRKSTRVEGWLVEMGWGVCVDMNKRSVQISRRSEQQKMGGIGMERMTKEGWRK